MADAVPRLRFLGHSTVLLELDEVRILTDPVLVDRLGPLHRHAGDAAGPLKGVAIDLVLISHGHHDHLHLPSLRRLEGRPRIVVPTGLGHLLAAVCDDVVEIAPGQRLVVGRLVVEAIRARHHGGRGPLGPTSEALGYRVAGRSRVYFAGDTDLFPGMADIAPVDVALVPVAGWGRTLGPGHLDPVRAAEAVHLLRADVAVPIHWGPLHPFWNRTARASATDTAPRAFAAEVRRRGLPTTVAILRPGESLSSDDVA